MKSEDKPPTVPPEMRFDGLVAVVTGGGRGLGKSYAELLARRGASVVVDDTGGELDASGHSPDPADHTVAGIVDAGGRAVACYESVASRAGAQRVVATALETFGSLDIVINNAGVQMILPMSDTDPTVVQRHLDVHVLGSLYMVQEAWPALLRSSSPRVVNTTSIGILGLDGYTAYSAAKAAVLGLTRTMAHECRDTPVRINAIAPTAITRMVDAHFAVLSGAIVPDEMRRAAPPELVAPVVAFLAHPDCQLSGEVLTAGGGRISRLVLSETRGVIDPCPTPEAVAASLSSIVDDTTVVTMPDTMGRAAVVASFYG